MVSVVGLSEVFQSTPPREGRHAEREYQVDWVLFQSTPPREGRPGSLTHISRVACFNPRPRARGD